MKPILFSTPMVQAILEGRKTQTRRKIAFPFPYKIIGHSRIAMDLYLFDIDDTTGNGNLIQACYDIKTPYIAGDILWVRETCAYIDWDDESCGYVYKADKDSDVWKDEVEGFKWKPSIFMPRAALEADGVEGEE